ncbi:MAG: dUTP diphosphatase [Desulfosalsimonas sp.]
MKCPKCHREMIFIPGMGTEPDQYACIHRITPYSNCFCDGQVLLVTSTHSTASPTVRVLPVSENARLPEFKTQGAACADLYAAGRHEINPGRKDFIRTGIAMQIPDGHEGQIRARSGLSAKKQLILLNGVATIDSDYRGEILVPLQNIGPAPQQICPGDRIAQITIKPVQNFAFVWASHIPDTARGSGGFGHTSINDQDATKTE